MNKEKNMDLQSKKTHFIIPYRSIGKYKIYDVNMMIFFALYIVCTSSCQGDASDLKQGRG